MLKHLEHLVNYCDWSLDAAPPRFSSTEKQDGKRCSEHAGTSEGKKKHQTSLWLFDVCLLFCYPRFSAADAVL